MKTTTKKEKKVDWLKFFAGSDKKRTNLFKNIMKCAKEVEILNKKVDYAYEDRIYRFYHHSFKIYWVQEYTEDILKLLKKINPHKDKHFCTFFTEIIKDGTGKEWKIEHNSEWGKNTRPIVEAFLHCKYFLDMITKTITIEKEQKGMITSSWAAILELYDLR